MHYVLCPNCNEHVEIPPDAIGPERTDPWNVIGCIDCGTTFSYDDEEVVSDDRPSSFL